MGLEKAIKTAVTLVLIWAAANQLPKYRQLLQAAELAVIKQSQTLSWGHGLLLNP